MQAPADVGPIHTVRFLSHATSARQACDMSYNCRSILKHVLKCMRQKSYRVSRPFEAWFPYRCICRICRTKKIHRTDKTLWKPPVQMLNTKETTDTTCCTR